MKITYKYKNFKNESMILIKVANQIIKEYQNAGYSLTLRQLYYQFVARGILANSMKSYNKLGTLINGARLAGLIDWSVIEDRTRNLVSVSHWDSPTDIINQAALSYRIDKWEDQPYRPEIWVEKEALSGVIQPVCRKLDIPFFSCRGYVSQSEMHNHARRLQQFKDHNDQEPIIIHLGDHDPSGIDMTRDIEDRMEVFKSYNVQVIRIALNYDQVEKYKPPPNPAKMTDSRFETYAARFGKSSWELDALEPKVLDSLITKKVLEYRDEDKWDDTVELENFHRERLTELSNNWEK